MQILNLRFWGDILKLLNIIVNYGDTKSVFIVIESI